MVGEGRGTYLWEDHSGGERPLGALLVRLFHLSSLINHFTADFLVWFGSLCSFLSGFCRLLSREVLDVASPLSLHECHSFRHGRRDMRVWRSNPLEGFLCKSFLFSLVDHSPLGNFVFCMLVFVFLHCFFQ